MDEILELLFQTYIEESSRLANDREYDLLRDDLRREERRAQDLVTSVEWEGLEPYFNAIAARNVRYGYLCFREGFFLAVRLLNRALSD